MAERERKGREAIRAKVRMPLEEWNEIKWAVEWRGAPSVSHIIRIFLQNYVRETRAMARLAQARRRAAEQQRSELSGNERAGEGGGADGSHAN